MFKYFYILGPTGVGKTKLSIELARSLNYPIINCDSLQVYKNLNIGTAKPSKSEMENVPHYLFDYVDAPNEMTAASYVDDVVQCIENKKLTDLVFVGGSGFYVQALEKGLFPSSSTPENIKLEIDSWAQSDGFQSLYQWLETEDPEFAKTISENDHYRIKRAVEIMKTQNKKVSQLKKEMSEKSNSPLPKHQSFKVGLKMDKKLLKERIEKRTEKMFADGFLEEVKTQLDQGLESWAPMNSVGYKECILFLKGNLTQAELFERTVISNMQLIKKQMTWFKRDPSIHWYDVSDFNRALEDSINWAKGS